MAYAYYGAITIDNTKVSGTSDLTDFPVLVSGTYDGTSSEPDIRTTGNGGNVENTDATGGASGGLTVPADLAFFSDTGQSTQLKHEIVNYSASTGVIVAWVKVPTVDYNDDTVIYMFYGDSGVTSSQEDIGNVWRSEYIGVWHMAETSGTRYDSSGNNMDLTDNNTVAQTTGQIYQSGDFTRTSSEYLDRASDDATLSPTGDLAITSWMNSDSTGTTQYILAKSTGTDNQRSYNYLKDSSENKVSLSLFADGGGTNFIKHQFDTVPGTGSWIYHGISTDVSAETAVGVRNASTATINTTTGGTSATSIHDSTFQFELGAVAGGLNTFDGQLEEVRMYAGILTADWMKTEYANQNSPSTFYSVGNETAAPAGGGSLSVDISGYTGVRVF